VLEEECSYSLIEFLAANGVLFVGQVVGSDEEGVCVSVVRRSTYVEGLGTSLGSGRRKLREQLLGAWGDRVQVAWAVDALVQSAKSHRVGRGG
jgi:hypothetical protein